MQERLNILGSRGKVDGIRTVFTPRLPLKLFQESVGELADGMAFQDTLDAIDAVTFGPASDPGPHPQGPGLCSRSQRSPDHLHCYYGKILSLETWPPASTTFLQSNYRGGGMTMIDRADSLLMQLLFI